MIDQKNESRARTRGRPRQFDPDLAVQALVRQFWRTGFSGTSIDELVVATGLKRASLYGAFGNKEAMYLASLQAFAQALRQGMADCFPEARMSREGLERFFAQAITLYRSGEEGLGCMIFCTAPADALAEPSVAAFLAAITEEIDASVARLAENAQAAGRLPVRSDPHSVSAMVVSFLQGLALRARCGWSQDRLTHFAARCVSILYPDEATG